MQIKLTITKNAVFGVCHIGVVIGAVATMVQHYVTVNGFNIYDPNYDLGLLLAVNSFLHSYNHLSNVPVTVTPAPSQPPATGS